MLAYVYTESGQLELMDMPKPAAKPGSVIIKVNAASICGTDFRTYVNGSQKIQPGTIIGHEASGTIVEIGSNVKGYQIGDRLQTAPAIGCGECRYCLGGHTNMCDSLKTIGWEFPGVFAEYAEIPELAFKTGNVTKVADSISDEESALAEPIACVQNSHEFLNIHAGDIVAVFGSGFIGCMHAELSYAAGAEKVIMLEVSDLRINEAKRLVQGAEAMNTAKIDLVPAIMAMTRNRGVDVAITACSAGKAHVDAFNIIAKRGRISLFGGLPGDGRGFVDSNAIHYKELSVFGVHASTEAQNRKVLSMIEKRQIDVKKYISQIFPLADIELAFEGIKRGELLKAVIKP